MTLSNFFTLMFASATSATVLLSGAPAPNRIVAVFETAAAEAACARNCEGGTQGPLKEVPSSTTLNQGQNQGQEQIQGQNTRQDTTVNTGASAEANSGSSSTSGASGTGIGVGGQGGNSTLQNGINVDASNRSTHKVDGRSDGRSFGGSPPSFFAVGQTTVTMPTAIMYCLENGDVAAKIVDAGTISVPNDTKYFGFSLSFFGGIGGGYNSGSSKMNQVASQTVSFAMLSNAMANLTVSSAGSAQVAVQGFKIRASLIPGVTEVQVNTISNIYLAAPSLKSQLGCRPTIQVTTTPKIEFGTPGVPTTTKKKKPSVPSIPTVPILY